MHLVLLTSCKESKKKLSFIEENLETNKDYFTLEVKSDEIFRWQELRLISKESLTNLPIKNTSRYNTYLILKDQNIKYYLDFTKDSYNKEIEVDPIALPKNQIWKNKNRKIDLKIC